jgi:hypothetical protein
LRFLLRLAALAETGTVLNGRLAYRLGSLEGEPIGEPDHQKIEDPSGMKRSEATYPLESLE